MTLRPGKLPSAALAALLARIDHRDPRVVVRPGIGRDAAVINLGDRMLVAKADPVTFAAEHIGWYAVNVNANDVACMGARPVWFLATLFLPSGAPNDLPSRIFDQVTGACRALDVELVGGHTEVTVGIDRPIVAGAMLGEAAASEIITGENAAPGDVVLLTKGIAIEGTALLAREEADLLQARGLSPAGIAAAASVLYDPGISVVRDAGIIRAAARPSLLHDPTEGGLATALQEVAFAASMTVRIDLERVRVLDQTRALCDALALDPLGLLASGSLLALVPAAEAEAAVAALEGAGVGAAIIGSIEPGAPNVIMGTEAPAPLPMFERDEIARFYEERDEGPRTAGRID